MDSINVGPADRFQLRTLMRRAKAMEQQLRLHSNAESLLDDAATLLWDVQVAMAQFTAEDDARGAEWHTDSCRASKDNACSCSVRPC